MDKRKNFIVVGGGLPGLFAAIFLSQRKPEAQITLIEKSKSLGGLFKSIKHPEAGIFDHGMHIFYETCNDKIDNIIRGCLDKDEWIYLQGNKKDIAGVFYNGTLSTSSPYINLKEVPKRHFQQCCAELFEALDRDALSAENFLTAHEYFKNRFGASLAEYVFKPIMKKFWSMDSKKLSPMATKIVLMDRINFFKTATMQDLTGSRLIRDRIGFPHQMELPTNLKTSQRGLYPKSFGINLLVERMQNTLEKNGVSIHLESEISRINFKNASINNIELTTPAGSKSLNNIGSLIWTIPTINLSRSLGITIDNGNHFDKPLQQRSVYALLNKKPKMGDLYYFYCFDSGFNSFRVTNYVSYCKSARRGANSKFPGAYPICVELHFSDDRNRDEKKIQQIAIKELLEFNVIDTPEDIVFSFTGQKGGGFPVLSCNNINIIKDFNKKIDELNIHNLVISGQAPERGIFFLNQVLENLYNSLIEI